MKFNDSNFGEDSVPETITMTGSLGDLCKEFAEPIVKTIVFLKIAEQMMEKSLEDDPDQDVEQWKYEADTALTTLIEFLRLTIGKEQATNLFNNEMASFLMAGVISAVYKKVDGN